MERRSRSSNTVALEYAVSRRRSHVDHPGGGGHYGLFVHAVDGPLSGPHVHWSHVLEAGEVLDQSVVRVLGVDPLLWLGVVLKLVLPPDALRDGEPDVVLQDVCLEVDLGVG